MESTVSTQYRGRGVKRKRDVSSSRGICTGRGRRRSRGGRARGRGTRGMRGRGQRTPEDTMIEKSCDIEEEQQYCNTEPFESNSYSVDIRDIEPIVDTVKKPKLKLIRNAGIELKNEEIEEQVSIICSNIL